MSYGLIIIAVVLVIAITRALTTHFVCPNCGAKFRLNIFMYIIAPHSFGKRMARCPECGHTDMLMPIGGKME